MLFAKGPVSGPDDSPVTQVSCSVHGRCEKDSARCEPWQAKAHGCALARGARDGYGAAVGLDDRLDDRHAEAGAALGVRRAREAVEDARERLGVDPRAGVADLDDRVAPIRAAGDDDAVAGACRLDRVLDERVDRRHEALLVGAHGAATRRVAAPLAVARRDAPAPPGR